MTLHDRIEERVLEAEPIVCERCPFWQHRNGQRVHQPILKAFLVRAALKHPWPVAGYSLAMVVGMVVGALVTK